MPNSRADSTKNSRDSRRGQADADIRAFYDTRTGDWLQLDYALGDPG